MKNNEKKNKQTMKLICESFFNYENYCSEIEYDNKFNYAEIIFFSYLYSK